MLQHYLHLKNARKQSHLTHTDMDYLLGTVGGNNFSKLERGTRRWSQDLIASYNILFQIPFEKIFEGIVESQTLLLIEKISKRLQDLEKELSTPKLVRRISFLQNTLIRLTQTISYEK